MNTAENIIPFTGNQQMTNKLPDPPVPADCDLSGFPFMPFDAGRFRDSTFVAESSLEIVGAACILWAAAWGQVPAGSLPDNDASLARMTGFGRDVAGWQKIRAGALYGFEKCSDGRLYHKHLTLHVIEAWERRKKRVSAAAQSWINRNKNKHEQSTCDAEDELLQSTCNANAELLQSKDRIDKIEKKDKHTVENPHQPTERGETATAEAFAVCVSDGFLAIWDAMPLPRVGKQAAQKAWEKVCRGKTADKISGGVAVVMEDLAERAAHVAGYDSPFLKTHLATYLNGKMWQDEDMPQRFSKLKA